MPWSLDLLLERFPASHDREIVEWLATTSAGAHGDLTERLSVATANLNVESWSPAPPADYPPVVLIGPADTIVAVAIGMRRILLRIPGERIEDALHEGEATAIGTNWISFDAFDPTLTNDEAVDRLRRWGTVACA